MSLANVVQYVVFLGVILLLVKPVGGYLLRVFTGQKTFLDPVCRPLERLIYRLAGIDAEQEMTAGQYAVAFVVFGLAIPALVLAGRFAGQPTRKPTQGTLPTDTLLFGGIIIGTALLVVALTYLPALALGPIIEQLQLFGH